MMFLLKKLLTPLILPPGCIIVLLAGYSVLLARRRSWKAGLPPVAIALLLWLASLHPFANALMERLERGQTIPAAPTGDLLIVLGSGIHETVPDLTGLGAPSEEALPRLVTTARLQRRLGVPVIVSGGAWFAGRTPEAVIMKRFLVDLGVPEQKVIMEGRSRDTVENARYCREICDQMGFRAPILITSAYHMRRALVAFGNAQLPVTPLPSNFKVGKPGKRTPLDWLPSASALYKTATALHEYGGMLLYRLAW